MTRSPGHTHFHLATIIAGSLALIIGTIPDTSWARPGGGGGRGAPSSVGRGGGGGGGMSRGGGGGRSSSMSRPSSGGSRASAGQRPGGGGASRPTAGSRPSASTRPGAGGAGTRPGGGDRGGNTINSGNRGGNTVNRGGDRSFEGGDRTRNTNINNDVNIDVDGGWDNDGWGYHPVAAGVAFGTAAAITGAVIGSMVYTLPPSCSTVVYVGVSYSQCGSVWYQPSYVGSSVSYTVVNPPY